MARADWRDSQSCIRTTLRSNLIQDPGRRALERRKPHAAGRDARSGSQARSGLTNPDMSVGADRARERPESSISGPQPTCSRARR